MHPLYIFLVPAFCISLSVLWWRSRQHLYLESHFIVRHCNVASIFQLLSPPRSTTGFLLASRAFSNARLIRAFSLTNTFVSGDPHVHSVFVSHASALLRNANQRGWTHFQRLAVAAVDAALFGESRLPFDVLVQDVTLRTVLVGLLPLNKEPQSFESVDVRIVASLITRLWSLSKGVEPIPPVLLPQLNHHLRQLIPDEETYPNPLDYVIPVWETLWRVVATVVALADSKSCRDIFSALHHSPTMNQFRTLAGSFPSAEAFVMEAMRLHPPSRRIMRATPRTPPINILLRRLFWEKSTSYPNSMRFECADVEHVLRDRDIWGPDAHEFDPSRFLPTRLQPRQDEIKSLPFGHGRYRCIAATWAPMAAAIISSAILDRVGEGSAYGLTVGKSIGGRESWNGWEVSN